MQAQEVGQKKSLQKQTAVNNPNQWTASVEFQTQQQTHFLLLWFLWMEMSLFKDNMGLLKFIALQ